MQTFCTAQDKAPKALSFAVPSGTLRAQRFGDAKALTICVHGLSANSCSFGRLGETLESKDRSVVALDLRGRGLSDVTAAGTYSDQHRRCSARASSAAAGNEATARKKHQQSQRPRLAAA